ncbi:cytochrome c [Paucibacter sp. APW11]|uniref:Cytochrome c n=1 Tax=Roseateles aquae TaxID=3077235 RepID=A0ABU3PE76_9BURK|nr:cytochrome c [Paucibacter sp. APW11]MDT9000226.1 cytochrome c [Paucibacter sp. APW11]
MARRQARARAHTTPHRAPRAPTLLLTLILSVSSSLSLSAQPAPTSDEAQWQRGLEIFTKRATPACAVCHTLTAAGSEGQIGPVLDELKPDAARVRRVLQSGQGVMPSYAGKLSVEDMEAVAGFVARASGGEKR